jgi:thiamine pyrophosphate-dependent acetolactate synthase large subunit-like protein
MIPITGDFDRRDVVRRLLHDRGDMLAIAGLGNPAWDISAAGDTPLNFPMWGAMGGAVPIGLGLALAQPNRRVLVITGDGEMLMGIGALATVALRRPGNLAIAVLDNARYGETGGQASHTASLAEGGAGTDLAGIARAAGIAHALWVGPNGDLAAAVTALRTAEGPVFATIRVAIAPAPLVLPPRDGALLAHRMRAALGVA